MYPTDAACAGTRNPDAFYDPAQFEEAAELCAGCPLILECRDRHADDPYAYAGGMAPRERAEWAFDREHGEEDMSARDGIMIAMFQDGAGMRRIGTHVGASVRVVQRTLDSYGLRRTAEQIHEVAAMGRAKRWAGNRAVHDEIIRLWSEGATPTQIVDKVDRCKQTVYATIRDHKNKQEAA